MKDKKLQKAMTKLICGVIKGTKLTADECIVLVKRINDGDEILNQTLKYLK